MSNKLNSSWHSTGFSLVELLVSLVIISLLMIVLISITDATRRTWIYTTGKAEQFRDSREAFESMTRKISQATLNTYWDYHYPTGSTIPDSYARQSELRFVCGNINTITGQQIYNNQPGHAVFFQAPLGYVADTDYANLNTLLNSWGYFIEFGSNKEWYPDFINAMASPLQERYRFRLMEMMEPSESLKLYNAEVQAGGNNAYTSYDWFTGALDQSASERPVRIVADNVIALILLPKLAPQEDSTGALLSPNYSYDSIKTSDNDAATVSGTINWKNQLPPIIQVTMIAVDDASFERMLGKQTTMPDLLSDSGGNPLFQSVGDIVNSSNPGYARDMKTLEATLTAKKLNYRIFTTNVSIKAAKWSRKQKN